jgi:hypothetical protein
VAVVSPERELMVAPALGHLEEAQTAHGPALDPVPLGEDDPSAPRTPLSSGTLASSVVASDVACTPGSRVERTVGEVLELVALGAPVCSSSDDDGGPAAASGANQTTILQSLEDSHKVSGWGRGTRL